MKTAKNYFTTELSAPHHPTHGSIITVYKAKLGPSYAHLRDLSWLPIPNWIRYKQAPHLCIQGFPLHDPQPTFPIYLSFQPSMQPLLQLDGLATIPWTHPCCLSFSILVPSAPLGTCPAPSPNAKIPHIQYLSQVPDIFPYITLYPYGRH